MQETNARHPERHGGRSLRRFPPTSIHQPQGITMTTKQFLTVSSLSAVICLAVAGAIVRLSVSPAPAPAPVPSPTPNPAPAPPAPVVPPAAIAQQKAKLKLSDGRTATFWFAASGSSLQCTAAIGLDQVLSYELVPAEDPAPVPAPAPDPIPTPIPTPIPNPTPTPAPTPQATSNLRVLFLYDPLTLIDMSPGRQAILGSPALRARISTSTARRNAAARPKYAP